MSSTESQRFGQYPKFRQFFVCFNDRLLVLLTNSQAKLLQLSLTNWLVLRAASNTASSAPRLVEYLHDGVVGSRAGAGTQFNSE